MPCFTTTLVRLQKCVAGQRAEQLADEHQGQHLRVGGGQRPAQEVQDPRLRGPSGTPRTAGPWQWEALHEGK